MYTYVISSLLTCVILLILTIFVLYKSPNRSIRRIYALHSTSIALWSFCFFKMISSTSRTEGLFWARILHTGAIFIPIFFYHFTLVTFNKAKYKRGFLTVSYIFGIILLIGFYLSPLFVSNVAPKFKFNYFIVPGKLYHLFTFYFWFLVCYTFYEFLKEYKSSSGVKKNWMKYLFIAYLVGYGGGVTAFLPLFNVNTPFWGLYLIPAHAMIIAYAIVAHQLFDINIIFRKSLGYSLAITALSIIFITTLFFLSYVFGYIVLKENLWIMLIIVTILALVFQPIYKWSARRVDILFFKGTLPELSAEKERLEEELRRSERLASIGMLASGLLHEIKNPLTPIRIKIEQLPKELPEDIRNKEFIQKFITSIPYEIDRITGLLNQLKEFANPAPLELIQINLIQVIDDRLNLLKETLS